MFHAMAFTAARPNSLPAAATPASQPHGPSLRIFISSAGHNVLLHRISGLSRFRLDEGELALISSEDRRRFFYLFSPPPSWYPFLGFNKAIPEGLVPPKWAGRKCVLHARVLPMGFRNSVGIAQHIHRNVVRQALPQTNPIIGAQKEMRKDRAASHAKEQYRIDLDILDNFDVIKKTDPETAAQAEGQPGLLSLVARHAYAEAATAPKKICLCQKTIAEVQGAIVDGFLGVAYPKPMKVGLYVCLALELLRRACYTVAVLFTFACSGAPFCLP